MHGQNPYLPKSHTSFPHRPAWMVGVQYGFVLILALIVFASIFGALQPHEIEELERRHASTSSGPLHGASGKAAQGSQGVFDGAARTLATNKVDWCAAGAQLAGSLKFSSDGSGPVFEKTDADEECKNEPQTGSEK